MVCWRLENNPGLNGIRSHYLCYTSATKLSSIFSTYLITVKWAKRRSADSWALPFVYFEKSAIKGGGEGAWSVDHNFICSPHQRFDESSDAIPLHDLQSPFQHFSSGLQWPKEASWLSVAWALNKPCDPPPPLPEPLTSLTSHLS